MSINLTGGGTLVSPGTDLTPIRQMTKYVNWIKTEFQPLILATPDDTIEQCVENAIRYWNTHSGYKLTTMFDYTPSTKFVQLNTQFKTVVQVYPCTKTTWIWNDHPLWTLLGVTIIDNVTSDLIMLSEAYRNYRVYVGADMRWTYEKSEDPSVGGKLFIINLPSGVDKVAVVGTKRITADEDIKQEILLEHVLRLSLAYVKKIEGNTLRKGEMAGIKTDGDRLLNEGIKDVEEVKKDISENAKWICLAQRA